MATTVSPPLSEHTDFAPPNPTPLTGAPPAWSPAKKAGFRFMFLYVLMLIDPWFTSTTLPGATFKKVFATPFAEIGVAPEAIKNLLYPEACRPGRLFHLCWTFENVWLLAVCLLGAALWTILDRNRRDYRRLNEIFRTILRFYVIADMLHFAVAKFTVKQFGIGPEGIDLVTPLGNWQGGTVMWRTMGESMVYGIFTGLGEFTAAILLLRRRTTTLGAMVLLTVASTIFTYDIVASHHYSKLAWQFMMISVILMAPDARRMRDFYLRNTPAPAATPAVPIVGGWTGWQHVAEIALLVLFVVFRFIPLDKEHYWTQRPNHPLVGLYEVERFQRNGRDVPPNLADSTRWAYLSIGSEGGGGRYRRRHPPSTLSLVYMDGAAQQLAVNLDTVKRRMIVRVFSEFDSTRRVVAAGLKYQRLGDSSLRIQSIIRRDTIMVMLRRLDDSVWPLRGGAGYVPSSMRVVGAAP